MKKGLLLFLIIYLFFSCAQQNQPLSGGPIDTVPPKIIFTNPELFDTNFLEQIIVIKFNEFIIADNIDQEFFSSPPFTKNPKFKVKGRKLIIHLKEPLQDSATYTFTFGKSIEDLHEGNKFLNYEYVFSTYDSVDNHSISGQVIDAYTFEPLTDIAVMLYATNDDSIPFMQLPLYITKTDSSGNFKLSRVGVRDYKIFALEDMNNNFIYNEVESRLAFSDTLITPWSELIISYDTIDSGTVIINPLIDTLLDTLRFDSVIVKQITNYYPDSLKLFLFTEGSAQQEIKRLVRKSKGLVKLFFVKPLIDNYIEIFPFDIDSSPFFEHKTEKFRSADSVYFWFSQKEFYDNDSLKFIAKYYNNDTILVDDTISFYDYDYGADTMPIEILSYRESISVYEPFTIISNSLIRKIDSSGIHLFELIDTVVADEKKQNVRVIRPNYDSLVFIFDRPIIETFSIDFQNYTDNDIPAIWRKSTTNDTVFCDIVNPSLHLIDSLKLTVNYDNFFFFRQIQLLNKTFELPITYQKIIKKERKTQDTISFIFAKDIPDNFEMNVLNFNNSNYNVYKKNNELKIVLKTHSIIDEDTLFFAFNFVDMKTVDNQTLFFDDTLKAIYVYDHQKIIYKRRYLRSKILIGFKKQFLQTPEIELLSFNPVKKWNTIKIYPTTDTLLISILNQRVLRLNTMRLRISYFDIDQHNDTLWFSDTLSLKVEHIADNNTQIVGREINLKLKRPVDFIVSTDTNRIRNININAKFLPAKKYELVVDSSAFIDLYGKTQDSAKFSFEVFSPSDFASLYLNIKNIWAVLDTVTVDTSVFYSLPQGQMILLIEDENGDIYKRANFVTDKILKDAMFLPGSYTLKLFFDKNNNGIWDTGNYFKHIQPEKVFIYKTKLNLTEGAQEKVIWDLAKFKHY